jgi:hypothetical protein
MVPPSWGWPNGWLDEAVRHPGRAKIEDDHVLLNPETGVYHLVNATGLKIIGLMDEGRTLDEAIEHLARESGQPHDQVQSDAGAFLTAMLERGLLVEVTVS